MNAELVHLYWNIGRLIAARQQKEGWRAAVIPPLASELQNELPEERGVSERNIKLMVQFAHKYPNTYPCVSSIGQPAIAQLSAAPDGLPRVAQTPWSHNVLLMQRVKDQAVRTWYMQ